MAYLVLHVDEPGPVCLWIASYLYANIKGSKDIYYGMSNIPANVVKEVKCSKWAVHRVEDQNVVFVDIFDEEPNNQHFLLLKLKYEHR